MPMPPALQIHAQDTVAVALRPLKVGESVLGTLLADAVPQGHKFALKGHAAGDTVIKYGAPIGRATAPIAPGRHVHVHNLATALAGELAYRPGSADLRSAGAGDERTWSGYRRADGRAATRNEVWILPTVGCVGMTAETLAREANARHAGRIDGVHAFAHPHGCSQLGDDLGGTRALLAGLAANPNAAGVLLLGLGCESNQLDALVAAVPAAARGKLRVLSSQSVGDEIAAGARLIDELVEQADAKREALPLSALRIGLKCGGSDGLSGVTANPLLGRLTDRLTAAGGSAILTEIPEIFGAERALLDRACDVATFAGGADLVNRFKRYYLDQGLPVSENPSPGNLAGGITTLEEKSLGAVQKAGSAPLGEVIGYGQQATAQGMVTLLEAPGNDAVSSTALAAAGATMVLFTTGRGTPLGFPVPTVKVASNHALAEAKPRWIDFDAAAALDRPLTEVDEAFLDRILAIASGEPTAAERAGQRAIAIWKRGVTL